MLEAAPSRAKLARVRDVPGAALEGLIYSSRVEDGEENARVRTHVVL